MRNRLLLAITAVLITFGTACSSKKPPPAAPKADTAKPADPAQPADAPKPDAPKEEAPKAEEAPKTP